MFGEVGAGRGFHAVGARAQENLVEVNGQDFVFGQVLFQAIGQNGFLDFALVAFFIAQKQALDHLLSHGAAALLDLSRLQVFNGGAQNGHEVDAVVLVELVVLNGQEGHGQILGHGRQGHQEAAFFGEIAHDAAVAGVNRGHQKGAIVGNPAVAGQVLRGPGIYGHSGRGAQSADDDQENKKRQNEFFHKGFILT